MRTLPEVHLVGYTDLDKNMLTAFLSDTGQMEFDKDVDKADDDGISDQGILTSLMAKLCYRSLDPSRNPNLSGSRAIADNLQGILKSAHGSVLEHVSFNFIITDCSRVFTHELVRHRVGTAFSQTSGRYCAIDPDTLHIVWDPILDGCEEIADELTDSIERAIYLMECKTGIRHYVEHSGSLPGYRSTNAKESWFNYIEARNHSDQLNYTPALHLWPRNPNADFTTKKKLTSALRRFAPNGQANEIGFTANVRTLRHLLQVRTSRHAEWEIRYVFAKVWEIVSAMMPELFADAQVSIVDELPEISGMKMLPYE